MQSRALLLSLHACILSFCTDASSLAGCDWECYSLAIPRPLQLPCHPSHGALFWGLILTINLACMLFRAAHHPKQYSPHCKHTFCKCLTEPPLYLQWIVYLRAWSGSIAPAL